MKDHCTMFFDGCWSECCKAHDKAFEVGSSKYKADKSLYNCIREKGHPYMAALALLGVSTFGWFWWIKARVKH